MRLKFFILPAAFILQVARAQDPVPLTVSQTTGTPVSAASSTATIPLLAPSSTEPASDGFTQISIIDYKSVYEAPTLEEEVKMAAERFSLTKSQQEVWATAATDRRAAEKLAKTTLESKSTNDYSKNDVYKGLRSAQTQFYETIIGYFDPTQKRAIEKDRIIIEEKRKMIAKMPPAMIGPTVTTVPVDSTAIKAAAEKEKKPAAKKKKKAAAK